MQPSFHHMAPPIAFVSVLVISAGGGSEAAAAETSNMIFGLREGTVWGLLSAIAFALHLVRSEIRQHEAKDVGQLAASQLIVCGVLSVGLLAWTGTHDPLLSPQLSTGVIASVRCFCQFNIGYYAIVYVALLV